MSSFLPSRRSTPRQRLTLTVVASLRLHAVEVERADDAAVVLQLDGLRRRMLDDDAQARDRRNLVLRGREPRGAGLQLLDVDFALGSGANRRRGGRRARRRAEPSVPTVSTCASAAAVFTVRLPAATMRRPSIAMSTRRLSARLAGSWPVVSGSSEPRPSIETREAIDAQALGQILGNDFRARARQRVVVGVHLAIAGRDEQRSE